MKVRSGWISVAMFVVVASFGSFGYYLQQEVGTKELNSSNMRASGSTESISNERLPETAVWLDSAKTAAASDLAAVDTASRLQVTFDVRTPYGSLKQAEHYLKSGKPELVAYFFSHDLQSKSASGGKTPADFTADCQKNFACRIAVDATSISQNYTTEQQSEVDSTRQTLVFDLVDINSAAALLRGNQKVRFQMIDVSTHWVIDGVQIGDEQL